MFDPNARAFQRNPYPTYEQLRSESPILYHEPSNLWFISTYQDVSALLKDRRLGRSIEHVMSREARGVVPPPESLRPFTKLSEFSMFDMEPPDHTRLRSLVHKAFTPSRVAALRGEIEKIAETLLDGVEAQGSMDIIEDFAMPLPVTVIAELLGVPAEDRHKLRPWSQDIVKMYELEHTPEQERRAVQAAIEFSDYLRTLAHERRADPRDDLMTALVTAEEAGDRLTEDELIATCVLLLNAGHEATVNVIGNGLLALFHHPDQLQSLKDNPAWVASAVEEMMRYDTPLQLFRRWILEDIDYRGYHFRQGTEVALLFGSANRDPARFDMPERLNIRREDNAHISFGAGIHFCLGAPLARLELAVAVGTLFRRFPTLQLAAEPEYKDGYVIRGLKELCVQF